MFDGVPHEQLHQFIGSSRPTSNSLPLLNPLPLPLPISSFSLHHHHSHNHVVTSSTPQTNITINSFDSSYPHHQLLQQQQQQQQFLHPILHHKSVNVGDKREEQQREQADRANNINNSAGLVSDDVDLDQIERERPPILVAELPNAVDEPWSNDEVLALLRIRSTMESWFPDFTWDHVSRKLAELGFKIRSAEKCKEKYEEENRYFNNINNCTKNFRPYFLSELEELYNSHTTSTTTTTTQQNPPQNNNNNDDDNNGATIGPQIIQTPVEIIAPSELARETSVGHQDKRGLDQDHHHHHQIIHDEIFGAKECSDHDQKADEEDHKALETTSTTTRGNVNKKRKRPSSSSSHHDHHHHHHHHEKNSTRFEMFKGFCEGIVNKLMAQQEEMHNKLLEDMVKRDREKLQKEEAWKKSEMDRMNKELDIMAREQAVAGDRQAAIIEFLRKFTSISSTSPNSSSSSDHHHGKNTTSLRSDHAPSSSSSLVQSQPNEHQNPNGSFASSSALVSRDVLQHEQNPSCSERKAQQALQNPSPAAAGTTNDQDLGKRWPRDEVLALINLRCSVYNNGDQQQQQLQDQVIRSSSSLSEQSAKAVPLWERISQGMAEMGYKRSAKRCKEKWENINKYFRKTKDVNKKRSLDSRTCPYFHQLSTLYNKGTLHENHHHHQDIHDDHQRHDHRDGVGEGERSSDHDHVITITSVGVGPAGFDFEF